MGPMAIRACLRRTTHRIAVLYAVLVLAGAVVVHHGAPAHDMGGMHGEHGMAVAAMCIGTVAATVAIVGIVGAVLRRRRLPRTRRILHAVVVRLVATAPLPRARSSPLYLQLSVIRR